MSKHVFATHPKMKNYSGHARGRVLHLAESAKRGTLTLCNMAVDSLADEVAIRGRRVCFICTDKQEGEK